MTVLEPHYRKAEAGVVGSVILNPDTYRALKPLQLQRDDFHDLTIGRVWEAFTTLSDNGLDIDLETVTIQLEKDGVLADIGGYAALVGLANAAPMVANPESYGLLVKEAAMRRRILRYAEDAARLAHSGDLTIKDIHEELSHKLNTLGGGMLRQPTTAKELSDAYLDRFIDMMQTDQTISGYDTGFASVNRLLGHSYGPGTLTIIGAYLNAGKSFLMIQMAMAAARQGIPTLFVTYESMAEEMHQRLIAIVAGLPLTMVQTMAARGKDAQRIIDAATALNGLPLSIQTIEHIDQIEAAAQDLSARYDYAPPAIFIDSLDNLANFQSGGSDYDRLKYLIPRLMPLALRLRACIVATKQLRVPEGVNAESNSDALFRALRPHIRSFEGGSTAMQTATNGLVFWSADWIQQKFNPRFVHPDMTPGYIYLRKLRARNDTPDVAEVAVRWNARVPRFEDVEPNI